MLHHAKDSRTSRDEKFVSQLCRRFHRNPLSFLDGVRRLDAMFSLRAVRTEQAHEVLQRRAQLRRELESLAFDDLDSEGEGRLRYSRWICEHFTDPLSFEHARETIPSPRRLARHLRALRQESTTCVPPPVQSERLGRIRSRPTRRLHRAIRWACDLDWNHASIADARAVCILVVSLYCRQIDPLAQMRSEFLGLPWDGWATVDGEPFQGRSMLAEELWSETSSLVDAARKAVLILDAAGDVDMSGSRPCTGSSSSASAETSTAPCDSQADDPLIAKVRALRSAAEQERILPVLAKLREIKEEFIGSSTIEKCGLPAHTLYAAARSWQDTDLRGRGTSRLEYRMERVILFVADRWRPRV